MTEKDVPATLAETITIAAYLTAATSPTTSTSQHG